MLHILSERVYKKLSWKFKSYQGKKVKFDVKGFTLYFYCFTSLLLIHIYFSQTLLPAFGANKYLIFNIASLSYLNKSNKYMNYWILKVEKLHFGQSLKINNEKSYKNLTCMKNQIFNFCNIWCQSNNPFKSLKFKMQFNTF